MKAYLCDVPIRFPPLFPPNTDSTKATLGSADKFLDGPSHLFEKMTVLNRNLYKQNHVKLPMR